MTTSTEPILVSRHHHERSSVKAYVYGFIASLVLTLTAYLLVTHHFFSKLVILVAIICLAMIQFLVQLFCFLHLGRENRPRWKLAVLIAMVTVVFILVAGSLWIMANLNYRMTEKQMENYMNNQDGL